MPGNVKELFNFKYCLLCEDIRKEINNKYFLIGVYRTEAIFVQEFPAHIDLAFWVVGETTSREDFNLTFRLASKPLNKKNEKFKSVVEAGTSVVSHDPQTPLTLPLPRIQLSFKEDEILSLQLKTVKGAWKSLKEFQVKLPPKGFKFERP